MIHLLAQVQAAEWWAPLVNGGSAGAVLGAVVVWLAVRVEKLLEKFRTGMERNTNALMIAVLQMRHQDAALRPLAERIAQEAADASKPA